MNAASTISGLGRLTTSIAGSVARIELRHPPLNIIDVPMMEELAQVLSEIESRRDVAVIVLRGEGKVFSAGVDVAAHTPDRVEDMLAKFHGVIRALVATKKVTIAAVHGHCLGGGAELAMVCDIVYTTENAQWGFPEIKLGCYPPVACAALAALVGQKRAAELILTGRTISGRDWRLMLSVIPKMLSRNSSGIFSNSARLRSASQRTLFTRGIRFILTRAWPASRRLTLRI
jgi:enoyl-CoA hydratase/carnithine racemase